MTDTSIPETIDENARRRFEAAWAAGRPEAIEQFLPAEADSHYLPTLEELVHIDLEFAWKSWQSSGEATLPLTPPPLVENYLKRFAQLNQPAIVRRLLEQERLVRHRHGDRPSPTEYCARFPDLVTTRAEVAGWQAPANEPAVELPAVSGYELLEVLGRGGMGVVYKALHRNLGRLVALKMILAGGHAGPQELARFRTEAEAVARLQHPNVVQIFEVGAHDGRPYLALEFVAGGSLAQHLAGTPQTPRPAAELVETLARAVDHAHQRGIVHRDLKPANILLQNANCKMQNANLREDNLQFAIYNLHFAIPKITDFGLAKILQSEPGTSATLDRTQTGAVLGTPSYMAPEQARGDKSNVGVPADVYALGAILYEMLTGRPPFRGSTTSETIQQVLNEDPVPPLGLQRSLPRDLQTICLKCLHKEPARRYASALELADDLHRFLAGEPVRARPTGRLERAVKWARRRPAAAALLAVGAGVLVILALGGLAYNAWLEGEVRREQERTRESERLRAETRIQRDRAEANFQLAREAVERMLTRLGTRRLVGIPHMERERLQALQDARAFYEQFLTQRGDDPAVRRDAALAHAQLAHIHALLGEHRPAAREYDQALRLQQELTAGSDPSGAPWRDLADTYINRGHLRAGSAQVAAAESDFREALGIRRRLAAEPGAAPIHRYELAAVYHCLGSLCSDLDRHADAVANFRLAIPILEKLVAHDRSNAPYRTELARTCNDLGSVLRTMKRRPEAKRALGRAIKLLERLAAEAPRNPDFRFDLANSLNNLALVHSSLYEDKEAMALHRRAIDLQRRLVADFGAVPDYHNQLGGTLQNLADLLMENRQGDEAWRLLQEALAQQWFALQTNPREPRYHEFYRFHCDALADALKKKAGPARGGWQDYYYAAMMLARYVPLARQDGRLPPSKRPLVAQAFAGQAVALLREAVRRGFRDVRQLQTEPAWAPLRSQPAFQQLMRGMEKS
jgi:serine/threonine protein kinase